MQTISRNYWPMGVIVVFALFFIGMASVVVIATTHRDHLVSDNYYERELKFQSQIDAAARAKAAGAEIRFDGANARVLVVLPVAQLAKKLSGLVTFYRASDSKLDREFLLEPKNDGTQTVNVSRLAAGLWVVRVKWVANGQSYFLEQKITVTGT